VLVFKVGGFNLVLKDFAIKLLDTWDTWDSGLVIN